MQMFSSESAESGADIQVNQFRERRRVTTVRRERPKIGRNEPCWCGSGKKYGLALHGLRFSGRNRSVGRDGSSCKKIDPGIMIDIKVDGFKFAGISCGIKRGDQLDLGLIVADEECPCAGVFTTNQVVAAPVVQSKQNLDTSKTARTLS